MSASLPKLKYVKFTTAKGRLYAYFNVAHDGVSPRYVSMPRYGTDEFFEAYSKLLAAREQPNLLTFNPDQMDSHIAVARAEAEASVARRKHSVVYFIQAADGPIKIGHAVNVENRLIRLQIGNAQPLKLLGVKQGGVAIEKSYHQRFNEHRIRGEWFHPHPDILNEVRGRNKT